jgi:hypothetical protein
MTDYFNKNPHIDKKLSAAFLLDDIGLFTSRLLHLHSELLRQYPNSKNGRLNAYQKFEDIFNTTLEHHLSTQCPNAEQRFAYLQHKKISGFTQWVGRVFYLQTEENMEVIQKLHAQALWDIPLQTHAQVAAEAAAGSESKLNLAPRELPTPLINSYTLLLTTLDTTQFQSERQHEWLFTLSMLAKYYMCLVITWLFRKQEVLENYYIDNSLLLALTNDNVGLLITRMQEVYLAKSVDNKFQKVFNATLNKYLSDYQTRLRHGIYAPHLLNTEVYQFMRWMQKNQPANLPYQEMWRSLAPKFTQAMNDAAKRISQDEKVVMSENSTRNQLEAYSLLLDNPDQILQHKATPQVSAMPPMQPRQASVGG